MKKRYISSVIVVMLMAVISLVYLGCGDETTPSEPVTYEIAFSDGLGSDPISVRKEEGETITLPENTFVNEGYDFAGWKYGDNIFVVGETYTVGTEDVLFVAVWRLSAPAIGQPAFSASEYDYDRIGGKKAELPLDLCGATVYYVEIDGAILEKSEYSYNTDTGCLEISESVAIRLKNGLHTVKVITDAADAQPVVCSLSVDNSVKTAFDEVTTKSFFYGKDDGVTFSVGYNGATVRSLVRGDIEVAPAFYEAGENSFTVKADLLRRSSKPSEYTLWLSNYDGYEFTINTNVIFYTDYDIETVHDETVSSSVQNSMYQDSTRVAIVEGPTGMDGNVLQITPHTVGGQGVYHGYYTLRAPTLDSTWKNVGFEGDYFLVEFDYMTEETSAGTLCYRSITSDYNQNLLLGPDNDGVVHHYKTILSKDDVGGGVYLYAFFENGGGKIYVDNFTIAALDAVPVLTAPETYRRDGDLQLEFIGNGYAYIKTLVDGNEVSADYNGDSGIVTVEKSLLDGLVGEHTVSVVTKLGEFSAVVRILDGGTVALKDTRVKYSYGADESIDVRGSFSDGIKLLGLRQLEKTVDGACGNWNFAICDTESNFADLVTFVTGENDSGYLRLPAAFLDKFYGETQFAAEFSNGSTVRFTVDSDVLIMSNFDESTVNGAPGSPIHSGMRGIATVKEREAGNKALFIGSTQGSGNYATAFTVEFDANPNAWFGIVGESGKFYRITFDYSINNLSGDIYFCVAGTNDEDFDENIFGGYDDIAPWGDVGGRIARYNLIADGKIHTFDSGYFTYNPNVRMTKIQLPEFDAAEGVYFMLDNYRIIQTTNVVNPIAELGIYEIGQTASYGFDYAKSIVSVTIDGNDVAFTQQDGNVIIDIDAMNELSAGRHQMCVITDDCVFRNDFRVKAQAQGVAMLTETKKYVTYGGGDVTLAGRFDGVTVSALTRNGGFASYDGASVSPVAMNTDYITLSSTGMTLSAALVDRVYGTMSYEVTFSDGTALGFTLTSNNLMYSDYDETKIYYEATASNVAICQDTSMISIVDVNGDKKLKYVPENATLGHAVGGRGDNGALTFSIARLDPNWLQLYVAEGCGFTVSFDYDIDISENQTSCYAVYCFRTTGTEAILLDATKKKFEKTFTDGTLARLSVCCPAVGGTYENDIVGTYMLIDNFRVTVDNDGAMPFESIKHVRSTDTDVKFAGDFSAEGLSVVSVTRKGSFYYDNGDTGYRTPKTVSCSYVTIERDGLVISSALISQIYGTQELAVTFSNGKTVAFTLISDDTVLYADYDETLILCRSPNANEGICQDTGMLSVVEVNEGGDDVRTDKKLKFTPADATLGHAANGGQHNGAFTFSVHGLHSGWAEIILPADKKVTLSFDYEIVLGDSSVSGYSVYYSTKSGGETVELLDPTQTSYQRTFEAGELACFKLFCPATDSCSFADIVDTYMLFDNLRIAIISGE